MGYSTPKKQLDLNDFLSEPAKPRRPRNNWTRGAASKTPKAAAKRPAAAKTDETAADARSGTKEAAL